MNNDVADKRSERAMDRPVPTKPPLDAPVVGLILGLPMTLAATWYLLREFSILLRPLLLAVLFAYFILPWHWRLTRWVSPVLSVIVLSAVSVGSLWVLTSLVFGSAVRLNEEMPILAERVQQYLRGAKAFSAEHLPPWLTRESDTLFRDDWLSTARLQGVMSSVLSVAASTLSEAFLVGIYLIFLLAEVSQFSRRVRGGFDGPRAEKILAVVHDVNTAMADYLSIKVRASLVLALPVTLVLWGFGVHFAIMWGVFTFLFNFIPYVGSILACTGPILLAFAQLDSPVLALAAAVVLITIHTSCATLIEPAMTGKALGLSPLVVLVSMSFWGLCWGVIGMILAIPLTVMIKVVLDSIPATRPVARLLTEG